MRRGSGLLAIRRRKGHPTLHFPFCPAQGTLPSSGLGELPRAVLAPKPGQGRGGCVCRPVPPQPGHLSHNLGCAFRTGAREPPEVCAQVTQAQAGGWAEA